MKLVVVAVVVLVLGAFGGYFFGYGNGYTRATLDVENADAVNDLAAVMSALVGKWRSMDDASFVREFASDGVSRDSYGTTTTEGRWMAFTKQIPDPAYTGTLEDNAVYVAIGETDTSSLYFRVVKLTANELEMTYLDRGNALRFVRIPQ